MTLWEAPFRRPLRILELSGFGEAESEIRLVLSHLGLDPGEIVEKIRAAPLRDPISLRIGEQVFTLRREICLGVKVEAL